MSIFRNANNLDASTIREMVFQVLIEYGLKPDPAGTDLDLNDIEGNYERAGGCFLVIVNEVEEILGCGGISPQGHAVCELRKMYLKKQARGQGLGKALLTELLSRAKALGFEKVELETACVLKEAGHLYKKFGFLPFNKIHLSPRCNQALCLDLSTWQARS